MPANSAVYDALSMRNRHRLTQLGERLKQARQRRNWTQQTLADKSGISVGTIKKLEAGHPHVPLAFLLQSLDIMAMAQDIETLALPENDRVGQSLESHKTRQRVRNRTEKGFDFDFGEDF